MSPVTDWIVLMEGMMRTIFVLVLAAIGGCSTGPEVVVHGSGESVDAANEAFNKRESATFERYARILKDEGRMPEDFARAEAVLGQFGFHNSSGSVPGARGTGAFLALARGGGSFGAYSFYPPAFEQAKRAWWIHGVMEAGSDILRPVNRNARFHTRCYGVYNSSKPKPCPNTMNSPIGYRVNYISTVTPDGRYVAIRGATVIGIPTYSDGSPKDVLQLDQKASGFGLTYDIGILPPDWVDMCACHP